jgi:hypothetical protein
VVRKAAGIDFPGWDPTTSWLIAEVEMEERPEIGIRREGGGIGPVNREKGGGPYRVVLKETHVDHIGEPGMDELREVRACRPGEARREFHILGVDICLARCRVRVLVVETSSPARVGFLCCKPERSRTDTESG